MVMESAQHQPGQRDALDWGGKRSMSGSLAAGSGVPPAASGRLGAARGGGARPLLSRRPAGCPPPWRCHHPRQRAACQGRGGGGAGTGRSLSLKLLQRLRDEGAKLSSQPGNGSGAGAARTFREVALSEPIRCARAAPPPPSPPSCPRPDMRFAAVHTPSRNLETPFT